MGKRKITVKQSVADNIARIAWFVESHGMVATAEKFSDSAYGFFEYIADKRISFSICRDPERAAIGYKCVTFKKKYTVVFIETETEITICEFIASKLIRW